MHLNSLINLIFFYVYLLINNICATNRFLLVIINFNMLSHYPYQTYKIFVIRIFIRKFKCIRYFSSLIANYKLNIVSASPKIHPRRIIIIGAGIAGIIAARQLKFFGLDAIILEARVGYLFNGYKNTSSTFFLIRTTYLKIFLLRHLE